MLLATPDASHLPLGKVAQQPLGLVRVVDLPGLPQRLAHRGVQRFGQALDHVARLMFGAGEIDEIVIAFVMALLSFAKLAPPSLAAQGGQRLPSYFNSTSIGIFPKFWPKLSLAR